MIVIVMIVVVSIGHQIKDDIEHPKRSKHSLFVLKQKLEDLFFILSILYTPLNYAGG